MIRHSGHLVWLATSKQVTELKHFGQLKDHVKVVNASQALKLVRIKTAFARYLRPQESWNEVEVISITQVQEIPNFGIAELPFSRESRTDVRSGYLGVLSQEAYLKGRFKPAKVRAVKNHFQITRWIYKEAENGRGDVLQVRETLGKDGSYSRKVLRKIKEPLLPMTVMSS